MQRKWLFFGLTCSMILWEFESVAINDNSNSETSCWTFCMSGDQLACIFSR